MEAICLEESVKNNTLRWQPMVAIVLIVLVAKFVYAYSISAQSCISLLNHRLPQFRLLSAHSKECCLQLGQENLL